MKKESAENFTETSKRAALAVATFGAFMTPFDGSVVTSALPSMEWILEAMSFRWAGWQLPMYWADDLCHPFGRLADIRGRRLVYVLGLFSSR